MEKKYTIKKLGLFLLMFFTLSFITNSYSQVTTVSSEDYGRIFDVVYDQNTQDKVYAASMNNHILVSNDNGVNWEVFYSLTSGFIYELRMLNNTHLSYYVTNASNPDDVSIHLLELSSMTETVINRPLNPDSSDRSLQDYSIYEANTNIMLYKEIYTIGFDNRNRVHYTTDGGATWTMVYDEIANNEISVDKVLISYNDDKILFITRGNGANGTKGGVLISTDAGVNFTEYYAGINIRAVAVNPFNANHWMVGTDPQSFTQEPETIYQTLDAGANWSEVTIPFDTHFEKAINEVIFHPTIQDKIYVLETNEIAISTDGGATWSVQTYSPWVPEYYFGLSATFNPYDVNEVIYTSNWYPYRSTDGGATINRMYTPFAFTTSVALANEGLGQDGYLYYGVQGGLVSKNLVTDVDTSFGVQSIDLISGNADPKYFVDNEQYGRIFSAAGDFNGNTLNISTDHGQSFNTFYAGFFDPVLNLQPDPVNASDVWVSFETFSGNSTYIVDITSADPWSPTISQITMPSTGRHYSTWINPNNNQQVLAGIGGEVWSSTDRGVTWTNSSSGLTLDINTGFIYSITQSPYNANEFVLATENGVWKSTDNYGTWTQVLATNHVTKIGYDPNNQEVLVAGVPDSANSSSAIYYSEDYGSNWTMIPVTELQYSNSNSIAFDFMNDGEGFITYIATPDLGVITYDVLFQTLSIETPTLTTTDLLIHPNPVKDVMNISIENGVQTKSVVIYNMLGAVVKQTGSTNQINISDLTSGVYLVKVTDSAGKHFVKRIIKR